ncbi:hypothetical protein AERO8C_120530 [Aeromonas veronii]|uniref:Uncharacterized protein n=1 Tax=Aeromonas veronii TaxID=654 RepID=A0A653KSC4_AERVE|nr:hypothetical protein AERO8C_120530 [Aeromonas veronii]
MISSLFDSHHRDSGSDECIKKRQADCERYQPLVNDRVHGRGRLCAAAARAVRADL